MEEKKIYPVQYTESAYIESSDDIIPTALRFKTKIEDAIKKDGFKVPSFLSGHWRFIRDFMIEADKDVIRMDCLLTDDHSHLMRFQSVAKDLGINKKLLITEILE